MEANSDRIGHDYVNFKVPTGGPAVCQVACKGDARCKSWTYVKPGVYEPTGRCWLKAKAPPGRPNQCCVSGLDPKVATKHALAPGVPL